MADEPRTRAGMVALVGFPNAGKSTLMNALLGERLSVVTPRAQTTWRRITAIVTTSDAQLVLLDTPGLLRTRDLLQRSMLEEARSAVRDADVVLLVTDATRPVEDMENAVARADLTLNEKPLIVAVNKADLVGPQALAARIGWCEERFGGQVFGVSAVEGQGLAGLRTALENSVPLSPFLFPEDHIATQSERFFVGELIRETVFEQFDQEIPYAVVCAVEEFREEQEPVYVQATLYAERESQKRILIGKGGSAIRALGQASRTKVEHLIGRPVYLDLWVKALPGWRRKPGLLARFGFRVPEDHDDTS